MMKIKKIRGDLTDISAKKEALVTVASSADAYTVELIIHTCKDRVLIFSLSK